jgi:hypothetical protein
MHYILTALATCSCCILLAFLFHFLFWYIPRCMMLPLLEDASIWPLIPLSVTMLWSECGGGWRLTNCIFFFMCIDDCRLARWRKRRRWNPMQWGVLYGNKQRYILVVLPMPGSTKSWDVSDLVFVVRCIYVCGESDMDLAVVVSCQFALQRACLSEGWCSRPVFSAICLFSIDLVIHSCIGIVLTWMLLWIEIYFELILKCQNILK